MEQWKTLSIRLTKEIWVFAQKKAIDKEISLNELIRQVLADYKNKCEKY